MLAIGSVVAGAGILSAALLALLFRNPRAPRWTRPELVVFLLMVPVAGMIGFGLGYAVYGANALLHGEGDLRELLALVAVPAVVALIWHVLGIKGRLRGYAAATGSARPDSSVRLVGAVEEPPESPAPSSPPRPPTRKAA
jgi:hypothetical protein